jgi:hypothetical protein
MADKAKPKTGLEDALSVEATYYATPIPQSMAVLTILGAVFDKVHFPGVIMPVDNFDQKELDKEIARIEGVTRRSGDVLLPMVEEEFSVLLELFWLDAGKALIEVALNSMRSSGRSIGSSGRTSFVHSIAMIAASVFASSLLRLELAEGNETRLQVRHPVPRLPVTGHRLHRRHPVDDRAKAARRA